MRLKKDRTSVHVGWTPEAADKDQQTSRCSSWVVIDPKTWVSDEFGEARKDDCIQEILANHLLPQGTHSALAILCLSQCL